MARLFDELVKAIMEGLDEDSDGSLMYGINFRFSPDGVPIFDGFERLDGKKIEERSWDPLVDVIDNKNEVTVLIDLRDTPKQEMRISSSGKELMVSIKCEDGTLRSKTVNIPQNAAYTKADAKMNNGILEIKIQKGKAKRKTNLDIKMS